MIVQTNGPAVWLARHDSLDLMGKHEASFFPHVDLSIALIVFTIVTDCEATNVIRLSYADRLTTAAASQRSKGLHPPDPRAVCHEELPKGGEKD